MLLLLRQIRASHLHTGMDIRKIERIISLFKIYQPLDTPIALICNGTLTDSNTIVGTVGTFLDQLHAGPVQGPDIIVSGTVNYTSNARTTNCST